MRSLGFPIIALIAVLLLAPACTPDAREQSKAVGGQSALKGKSVTGYGLDTKIGELLDNPATKAVLERHIAALMANPQFVATRGITLRVLQHYAKDELSDDKLRAIADDLAKVRGSPKAEPPLFIPNTISPTWQAFLRNPPFTLVKEEPAPPLDTNGWAERWRRGEQALTQSLPALIERYQPQLAECQLGGTPVIDIKPRDWKDDGRVLVYCHGGGYTMGSAKSSLDNSLLVADHTGLRVISVDYTVAPKAKWQKITDQVIVVFEALQKEGYGLKNIGIYGDSAGGGLAAGVVLKMRDEGLGMPAAVVLWSPWSDITETGETYVTLKEWDPLLSMAALRASADAYADRADQKNPYVSPVYGDYTKGFPPTLIQGGTREIFLSNFVRQYQAIESAGVKANLDLYEGMIHVFQPLAPNSPESQLALRKMKAFLDAYVAKR